MALEPEFWDALAEMAAARSTSIAHLIAEIDETRENANLSSAVRVAVLNWYITKAGPTPPSA